jgi:nitrogenase-associated protein
MASITFFEKTGCQNNRKQKEWLELSGHAIRSVSILDYPWSRDELLSFFHDKPVAECFNPAAPALQSGKIDPAVLSQEEALSMMIDNPILIQRPLMIINGKKFQGFNTAELRSVITLEPLPGAESIIDSLKKTDINTCPHTNNNPCHIKEQ